MKQDGTLWAWGANDRGQLGDGTTIDRLSPVKVADGIADTNAYYALTTDGRMLEIGNGFAEAATGVSRILNGSLAIMTDGSLWSCSVEYDDYYITDDVISACESEANCYVIKTDHSLWSTEMFSEDETFSGTEIAHGYKDVASFEIDYDGGWPGFVLLDTDNVLYYLDYIDGDGNLQLKKIADNITAFAFSSVTVENDCGTHFCIDTSGQLYAWGKNYYGVFGKGRTAGYSDTPVTVAFPN